jgi:AraC-like DNA-binding protein
MQLKTYEIMPALLPYIEVICTMECDEDADTRHLRVLPDARVEIFLSYTNSPIAIIDDQLYKQSIVSFRINRFVDVQMRKGSGCIAVCFYPGMAARFLKVPITELSNTNTQLSELWNTSAGDLEEKLAKCNCPLLRVKILQTFLIDLLADSKSDPVIAQTLQYIQLADGRISVEQLSNYSGFSQRQLARKFQYDVGMSPKEYLRVARFHSSLKKLNNYPYSSLTEIAINSGYYDQAHFIRDYKEFTGYTPGKLLQSDHLLY